MKTEVIMKRELFGKEISQKSKSGFFSATDLVKTGNYWRAQNGLSLFNLAEWFRRKSTIEFIQELENQYGGKVKKVTRGKDYHTWVHPYLFIDIALAINPKLKVEVYGWLFDNLIAYRNDSGDSYKKMCGALYINIKNKSKFSDYICSVANEIKLACDVEDWQTATEIQLKLRNKIHDSIALLCDVLRDNEQAVKLAIVKNIEKSKE